MVAHNPLVLAKALDLVRSGHFRVDADTGAVYGSRGKQLKSTRSGYVQVAWQEPTPSGEGKSFNVFAHRLVWAVATGQTDVPCLNHKNGIKTDNRIGNLEAVSHSENTLHAIETGLRPKVCGVAESSRKLTDQDVRSLRRLRAAGMRASDLAAQFDITVGHAYKIIRGAAQ